MTISTERDKVRLLIGDTDTDDPLLYDDEIAACIANRQIENADGDFVTNLPAAAADAAGAIAAKFSRRFNFAEDGQTFSVAQRVSHYTALEERLRRRAGGEAVGIPTT